MHNGVFKPSGTLCYNGPYPDKYDQNDPNSNSSLEGRHEAVERIISIRTRTTFFSIFMTTATTKQMAISLR